jgi:RNA ligase (TIGR02306 family)
MSSTFKVPLTNIKEILPHNNAERLEVAVVFGFHVIVSKGQYQVGDPVIYVPIDSILPQWLEDKLFPPDSKVKINKHRIRQIKLRGLASQGLLINPKEIEWNITSPVDDLAPMLGITKYEPPVKEINPGKPGKPRPKENPMFSKYGGLDNIKWYPEKFKADDIVVLQEKIHGTNARAAILPYVANTLYKKFIRFLGLAPISEFCYGSNNVQLQERNATKNFYGEDVYGKVFASINVKDKLRPGETIYGEIYGEGIQKNYSYGTREHKFVLFDVRVLQQDGSNKWLSPDEVRTFAEERGFDMIPEIYRGPFVSLEHVKLFTKGTSLLNPEQKIREGVVVKAVNGYDEYGQNRALKVISEDYLADESNTDFH